MRTTAIQSKTQTSDRRRSRWLTVGFLPRWVIYRPLAVLLSILLLPAVSWLESRGAGTPLFQADAQTLGGCASQTNSIIQNYCVNGVVYYNDLAQLESDAVSTALAAHNLPTSDAHIFYDYGREDLRNEVRGAMMDILKAVISKPSSQRSAHEKTLYTWLQTLVQQNEVAEYTAAVNHFNSFLADPCHFTLDPDLAAQYKLSYDGTPFCYNSQSSIFSPFYPASDYFVAYGIKQSYQKPAATYGYFPGVVAGSTIFERAVAADFAVLGGSISVAYFIPVVQILFQWVYLAFAISALTEESMDAALAVAALAPVINVIGTGAIYLGPIGIILNCIVAGIEASLEIYNNQQVQDDINNLKNKLAQVQSTPPDLGGFVTDSVGLSKLRMTLVAQTLPDKPSSTALPAHASSDLNFALTLSGGSPVITNKLAYQDWLGNTWNAQTSGGWFVQTCTSGTSYCPQTDSMIASINYVDWNSAHWIGSRFGDKFVSTKADPASTDVVCPADSLTGVSAGTNFSNCLSYVSNSIPLTDSNGNHVSVSLSVLTSPVFTSSSYFAFGPSIPLTQTITVTGNPTPSVCVVSSTLPTANFSLNGGNCGTGSFQLGFNGASDAQQGNYSLVLKASNSAGSVTQTLGINVSPQLAIISPSSMDVTAGVPANFTVVATGNPKPALSIDPSFSLGGLTFKDNGDGTGTISGIYSSNIVLTCEKIDPPGPCGIIATSSQGTVEQQFSLNVSFPPPASIPGCPPWSGDPGLNICPGTTFYAGTPNQALLTTTGETTPVVSWDLTGWDPGVVPSWLTVKDNHNGSALLQGTPPAGTSGTFSVLVHVGAAYALGKAHIYPVTVVNAPKFTSPSTAVFTAGTPGSFAISANTGTISLANTLPKGLAFTANGSTATISGTPAAGTGGQYTLTLNDDAGTLGSAAQQLLLNVNEAPQITSSATATMFVGMPGLYAITTTGFPNISNHAIAANAPAPTDPSQGNGMYFTVTGLPLNLQASNLNTAGFAGGTLTIQGTPSSSDVGVYQVRVTAQNGVGSPATQTLTLNIVNITGPAPASGTTCNGNYNGTFKGNITVSAGQNCSFFGGGVTGNVTVNAGNVALANATVTGSMTIQGPSAFSIGPGTKITGNLAIQSVASGSNTSRICQVNVAGNLEVYTNAIPINIGSPQTFCFGNSVGGNLDIQGNTAAVGVYENTVGKSLSCSSNTSITGAANSAQKKQGQCAAF